MACSNFTSFVVASAFNGFLTGGLMTIVIVHVQEIFGRGDYGHVISYIMFFLGNFYLLKVRSHLCASDRNLRPMTYA